jgi:sec-independent protein translocase protein TatA
MNSLAFLIPGMSGIPEILVIVFVVLLLFGGKRIPELFHSLGKSLNEFKRGMAESEPEKKADKPADAAPDKTPPSGPPKP